MSHRQSPAQILPEPHHPKVLRGVREPCHPEVLRGVRVHSAFRIPQPAFPPASSLQPTASPRSGLTLIEMLVALAVTLVMMAAVVNLFANVSGSIRNRRALIEVNGQLRQVRQRLALDLAGATCDAKTWQQPGENRGYIEIIEGPWSDANPSALLIDGDNDQRPDGIDFATSLIPSGGHPSLRTPATAGLNYFEGDVTNAGALGDPDDILALTVRNEAEPFKAQVGNKLVESTLAEVLWYADENAPGVNPPEEPGLRRIYRRVLLIVSPTEHGPWNFDASQSDKGRPRNVSVRYAPADPVAGTPERWVANTLGDLTKRENRAARIPADPFPFRLDRAELARMDGLDAEYLVLSDALAFDVRVYDPGAPLYRTPPMPSSGPDVPYNVLQPGDPGWPAAILPASIVGYGAYCDLGWGYDTMLSQLYPTGTLPAAAPTPIFHQPRPAGFHPVGDDAFLFPAVYDTWSFHYENNGINEDVNTGKYPWQSDTIDQGANGLDDDGANGVDDMGERETSPPYPQALRGLKAALRIYERDARQIREVSVTHSFVD